MKYYIELKTYPNPDFTSRKIIEDVFGRLHFIFASIHFEKKAVPIGVSFPQYTVTDCQAKCNTFSKWTSYGVR